LGCHCFARYLTTQKTEQGKAEAISRFQHATRQNDTKQIRIVLGSQACSFLNALAWSRVLPQLLSALENESSTKKFI
jgi:hypothetical protein